MAFLGFRFRQEGRGKSGFMKHSRASVGPPSSPLKQSGGFVVPPLPPSTQLGQGLFSPLAVRGVAPLFGCGCLLKSPSSAFLVSTF